ncbi:hypothetical protein DM02DRAFT_613202 [Periconia macrospinosa]|uniref:Reverse transcriptase domain-containing protein n=1 Tax=Periconia macrospinosa TaxID=97972 RepID=A0A2V1DUK7_9PLEO|nr:hypothetical protein DM02DRAFT_613202 [Periconia macrospinosa]
MSSGSVYSATLQTITTTKLEELAKHRQTFEKQYTSLLTQANAEPNALKRLHILFNGAKEILQVRTEPSQNEDGTRGRVIIGSGDSRLETDLKNLDRFLEQVRYDPSVSPKVLEGWEASVRQHLAIPSAKYQYADLYGKLVTEWLSSERTALSSDGDVTMADSFEEVPGVKKMESRAHWEKRVFTPGDVDVGGLKAYLSEIFLPNGEEESKAQRTNKSFIDLKQHVQNCERSFEAPSPFTLHSLRWVIESLEASDLLPNEKREVLKDFLKNDIILKEVADVLNMRMSALDRWTWGDFVPLEQRRQLNGTYSIHMHEDLLQAIFLHYIGCMWSSYFKGVFTTSDKRLYPSGGDNGFDNGFDNAADVMPREDLLRRKYYLGKRALRTSPSLQNARVKRFKKDYFAHQLLDYPEQKIESKQGEEEADFQEYAAPVSNHDEVNDQIAKKRKAARQSMQHQQLQQQAMQQQRQHMAQQQQAMAQQTRHHMAMQAPSGGLFGGAAPPQQRPQAFGARFHGNNDLMTANPRMNPYAMDQEDYDDDEEDGSPRKPKKPVEAKQRLLHLLSTEIVLNTHLHGELTCFRSVFESWNPLLPHATILTVLEFLGVSEKWRAFFKKFLEAPLKFMDDPAAEPRARRRGMPGSHALSDVFGEVVFSCLDLSVRRATKGGMLHRIYDDIWFWDKDYEKCAAGWASVTKFTSIMGVEINKRKTGSVRMARSTSPKLPLDSRLPAGEIRWGFLYLSATTSRFEIDDKMVTAHISDLDKQLQNKKSSVIDWIQAWNTYAATFMSSNFGQAANCFGRAHVDKMLETHRRVQETLFSGGNVTQFLKDTIRERFGVDNIPDGFLFFPVELGGLDVQSPFIDLLQIRDSVKKNPHDFMTSFSSDERADFAVAKANFDRDGPPPRDPTNTTLFTPTNPTSFLSFEEFTRYREVLTPIGTASLGRVYRDLLRRPTKISIDVSAQVRQATEDLEQNGSGGANLRGIKADWDAMEPYWKWVAQMYGPEMVERFGGLSVVDASLLPLGMIGMFRQQRVKWQG